MRPDTKSLWLPFDQPPKQPTPMRKPKAVAEKQAELEHVLGVPDVISYLKSKDKDPEKFCTLPFHCDLWELEDDLLSDLLQAQKSAHPSPELMHQLRGLIRAVSWNTHERPERPILLSQISAWIEELHRESQSAKRASDLDAPIFEKLRDAKSMEEALVKNLSGESAERAARAAEDAIGKAWGSIQRIMTSHQLRWSDVKTALEKVLTGEEKLSPRYPRTIYMKRLRLPKEIFNDLASAINEIRRLRPLRDQIYYQYLYPNWFKQGQK